MCVCRWFCALTLMTAICGGHDVVALDAAEHPVNFESEIAPLLIKRCLECHRDKDPAGHLVLTTEQGLSKGGDSGQVIKSGSPESSYLLKRLEAGEMPPEKKGQSQKLPDSEIQVFRRWIAEGANWPADRKLDLFEKTNDVRAGRDWWSLQPIIRPEVPQLKSHPANPIDVFVLDRLQRAGMKPAPPADRRTLLRRLYIDLIGLPPTAEQIEAFLADQSDDAFERRIEALLAMPQYGERWGRFWLDVVRYAETSGYERDQEKPFVWKYRDWVIHALNDDMPYDRFIVHQLAGDEIENRDEQSVIATGFLRLGTWNDEPNDPADYQYDRLEDLVHTTSTAFLGMTVKCARCHDHKFDAIQQDDYYRMASAYWAGPIGERDRALLGGPTKEELGYENVLGWTDLSASPAALQVLKYGERAHPLGEVVPASLSFVPALQRAFDSPPEGAKTTGRRLQLAQWIADTENPLPPRVLVNRLWLHHFGQGIIRTPNNFGFLADPPTHPELLDWLASEFLAGGMTIKRMHKLILTSQTWQQSSIHPEFENYQVRDAGNRLWWRAERRRLDAESLRDAMLAVSGDLDLRVGGPSFRPTISPEALEGLSRKTAAWQASPPEEQLRRSVYVHSKRGLLPPLMTTFDLSDATQPCGQRDVTTVPTQALALLNNRFVHERSEALAKHLSERTAEREAQIELLWQAVYGREPSSRELDLALAHLQEQQPRFEQSARAQIKNIKQEAANLKETLPASLVLKLRADEGVKTDSEQRVLDWQDQSGQSHHAQQAKLEQSPRLSTFANTKIPVIDFDGRSRFMHLDGQLLKNQPCTMVAVVSDRGKPGHREIISNWNAPRNIGTALFFGLTAENTVRFSDYFANAGQVAEREKLCILIAVNSRDRSGVHQNGRPLAVRDVSLPERNLSTPWVIGQQGNINGEFWNGAMAEIRVYSRSLSDHERRFVEQELSQTYNIPLAPIESVKSNDPAVLALASLCHVLLNSNEFLYVD